MHPASTTAASGGLSAAAVVILMWILHLFGVDMPADVAAALGVVVTAVLGYVMHGKIAAADLGGLSPGSRGPEIALPPLADGTPPTPGKPAN